jgi:hypothetical protein
MDHLSDACVCDKPTIQAVTRCRLCYHRSMRRFVLSGYLAFVTAVGPCLCCCAIARAAAPVVDESPSPCRCCNDQSPCERESKPARHSPFRPDCPCRQESSCCGLLPPPANKVSLTFAEWLTLLAAAYDSASFEPVAASFERPVEIGVRQHRPFLDTSDLLDVQHKLRC